MIAQESHRQLVWLALFQFIFITFSQLILFWKLADQNQDIQQFSLFKSSLFISGFAIVQLLSISLQGQFNKIIIFFCLYGQIFLIMIACVRIFTLEKLLIQIYNLEAKIQIIYILGLSSAIVISLIIIWHGNKKLIKKIRISPSQIYENLESKTNWIVNKSLFQKSTIWEYLQASKYLSIIIALIGFQNFGRFMLSFTDYNDGERIEDMSLIKIILLFMKSMILVFCGTISVIVHKKFLLKQIKLIKTMYNIIFFIGLKIVILQAVLLPILNHDRFNSQKQYEFFIIDSQVVILLKLAVFISSSICWKAIQLKLQYFSMIEDYQRRRLQQGVPEEPKQEILNYSVV